jgi:phage terminase large subunit-like protein
MNRKQYALYSLNAMDRYIDEVIAGKIIVGRNERLAVERHLNDLANGGSRNLIFDEVAVAHFFQFFSYLKHSKGALAGKQIILEGWQCFIFAMIFGWKKQNESGQIVRRFREAFSKVARKNGKTTIMSGAGLYGMTKDGEGGAEIYAAATKRDQAKQLFDEAKNMARQSAELKSILDIRRGEILSHDSASKFIPLSSDANSLDGLNPHFSLIDELHAHKTAELYNVLKSAYGARLQGLIASITTEGFLRGSINDQLHDYAVLVLEGKVEDDSFFAIIFSLDEGDDYFDEKNWRKANPNLGVSVSLDYLRDMAKHARDIPSQRSNFLTKHLNIRVNVSESWVDMDKWNACERVYSLEDMAECTEVFGGLDLASINDIASLCLIGNLPNGKKRVFSINWLPEDTVMERVHKARVPYDHWALKGWLITTPGNVIDYGFIRKTINDVAEMMNLVAITFDDWNSSQLVSELTDDGIEMLSMRQGYKSISPAMKELERLYIGGELEHNGNPVLSWAMGNVVATKDPAGNIKADKSKAQEKIDPAVAQIMAVGAMMNISSEDELHIVVG